jgi:NADH-quinone oxidoreductase subunit J
MAPILFFILATLSVGGVVGMIISRDRAHSVLFLVLAFAALGGVFGLLDAPFVAAVQVLVYAGAIMVLFVFVIMMVERTNSREGKKKSLVRIFARARIRQAWVRSSSRSIFTLWRSHPFLLSRP